MMTRNHFKEKKLSGTGETLIGYLKVNILIYCKKLAGKIWAGWEKIYSGVISTSMVFKLW